VKGESDRCGILRKREREKERERVVHPSLPYIFHLLAEDQTCPSYPDLSSPSSSVLYCHVLYRSVQFSSVQL
jgi:hypothetical protein